MGATFACNFKGTNLPLVEKLGRQPFQGSEGQRLLRTAQLRRSDGTSKPDPQYVIPFSKTVIPGEDGVNYLVATERGPQTPDVVNKVGAQSIPFRDNLYHLFNNNSCLSANAEDKVTAVEKKWRVHEKEAFAIFYALRKWEHHLQGSKFTLFTDHKNLTYLKKDPSPKVMR